MPCPEMAIVAGTGDTRVTLFDAMSPGRSGSTSGVAVRQPVAVPAFDPQPTCHTGTGDPPVHAVLDHVAVAAQRWELTWPRYVGMLGGRWFSGGLGNGFAPCQLRFANGARLEVLAPHQTSDNPFLARFLEQHGPGPHHLTFKVPDLDNALTVVRSAGFDPVGIDRSDPGWFEAFLHPRQAGGIVVQLAQQNGDWREPAPDNFPEPATVPSSLLRATHVVADIEAAGALFVGLLGGQARHRSSPDATVIDVSWDGPLSLRLVGPAQPGHLSPALASWLGGRTGRLHHVVFAVPSTLTLDGATIPGSAADPDRLRGVLAGDLIGVLDSDRAISAVAPEVNFGTRLVYTASDPVT